ncbi:hypothetical protein [Pseudomonas syringae group sp. 247E2]|uniref:restriction endonuclease-related protein n=1 Tax=Pseudomonas syringae group sp. 247E2 TaxID=3079592 RepID=UPI002906DFE0|nr:hypothetical protein [Pseudomonas syringae group sp. 247E2]MDU8608734.1 hypothetical protein [Pseudomonas syringae group sp. 247E2]
MDKHAPEHLLRLLAQGASLCATDRAEAFIVLQRASAVLWRLEPSASPMSAIKLEQQLRAPLETWLPETLRLDYSGPLLYSNIATQTCNEMLLELDVGQLWEEVQASVNRVKQACRLRAEGEVHYRNFRLFLIEHGVIFPSEAQDVFIPLNLSLSEFYDPIPLHLYHNGLVYLCPECRWPMNAQRHEVSCDSAWCQDKKSLFVRDGTSLLNRVNNSVLNGQPVDGRLMLKPALWKFTLQPGLIEIALANTLAGKGFDVRLWPDVDRTDLRIHLGLIEQDIDAKVWASPYELAKHIESIPSSKPRWIVIPDYQRESIPFLRERCKPGVSVFTQSQCVKEALKHASPF